ncbi:phosphate ABC transporter permease [Leptolyngbya ohadii]|uniref:phosphate ABC transporter permease n=1 Tax=Leptolyngbya ohadii TaxID=1962290 RepID=UPI0015C68E89|nr:phosphate ABC transporter permease [Leptolyngbya ohadii]
MLIPLTRKKFEDLIPIFATGGQYKYYWGKPSDVLRRFLYSLTAVVAIVLFEFLTGGFLRNIFFVTGFMTGFYWLWSPIFFATQRNLGCRRYKFSGFLQAEVLDVFTSEELVGTEETVNKRGDLVVIENRERCLNLEIGDEAGFYTKVQVPLQRDHRGIRPGDRVALVVMSDRRDLSLISKISDVYLFDYDLWVSNYPYLQRQIFSELCRRMEHSIETQDFSDLRGEQPEKRRGQRYVEPYDERYDERYVKPYDEYDDRDTPSDRFADPYGSSSRRRDNRYEQFDDSASANDYPDRPNRSRSNRPNSGRQAPPTNRPPLRLDPYPDDRRDDWD